MVEFEDVKLFDCHDMEEYIKVTYGKEVDVLKRHAEMNGNSTFVEINVNKETPDEMWWPDEDELAQKPDLALQRWLEGDDSINADECLILWDMCRKNLIPEGKYVMKAWW